MTSGEIDLGAYYRIIKKRIWFILICVVAGTFLSSMYNNSTYQPLFQASSKLLVNQTVESDYSGNEQMDFSALGINISLIDTYKEIIKTPIIMGKVVQRYPNLNLTADQLIAMINVYSVNQTPVMAITMSSTSYDRAAQTVNAVAKVFQSELPKVLKVNNVAILTEAEMKVNPNPISAKHNTMILLGFMASLVVSIGIVLILDSMDDTVKTEADIKNILERPLLTAIPKMKKRHMKLSRKKGSSRIMEGSYAAVKN